MTSVPTIPIWPRNKIVNVFSFEGGDLAPIEQFFRSKEEQLTRFKIERIARLNRISFTFLNDCEGKDFAIAVSRRFRTRKVCFNFGTFEGFGENLIYKNGVELSCVEFEPGCDGCCREYVNTEDDIDEEVKECACDECLFDKHVLYSSVCTDCCGTKN